MAAREHPAPVKVADRPLTRDARLVLLGCGGYIGSHLLDTLLVDPSVRVDGWDPRPDKIRHWLDAPNFKLRRAMLNEPSGLDDLHECVEAADAVINLAAICNPAEYNTDPITVIRSNFLDSYKVVEICAEAGKWLIHFSTSEVYGRTLASYVSPGDYDCDAALYELDEDETPFLMGPLSSQRWTYACAKQLLERYIYAHHAQLGMPYTIVRPLNFFGPRMDFIPGQDGEGTPRVLACFMKALLHGEPMRLVDGGSARRTIVSIRDAIRAIVLMLEKPQSAANQAFNVGNRDNEVTMAELADLMRKIYARITGDDSFLKHPIESVSARDFYGPGYEDCDRRMPRLDKARDLLGWTPSVSLEETLLETMTYYHDHYAVSRRQAG